MLSVPMFMTAFIRLPLSLFGWIALAALAVFGYRTGFNMIGGINKWIDDGEERVRAGIMGSIAAIVVWFWCHGNILFNYLEDTYVLYMNTNGKDDSSAKDYHKSLAGLGRVYADAVNQQNSTSPWQYYVATWTMFAVGAVICFLLVASCLRIRKSYKERLAEWNADTFENRFTPSRTAWRGPPPAKRTTSDSNSSIMMPEAQQILGTSPSKRSTFIRRVMTDG